MCGIVAYIGDKQAAPILLKGLKRLEYRGYDSAGVSLYRNGELFLAKTKGRIADLEKRLDGADLTGTAGIGHTRWATHGVPSDVNAHPHLNGNGTISLVHNGIIENYMELRHWLKERGVTFRSQTDTETVVHLIDHYYEGDLLRAVQQAVKRISGSYALAVVCSAEPDVLVAARKDSPLVIGIGRGENYIASDIPAILEFTRDIYLLEERETAKVTRDSIAIYDAEDRPVRREVFHVDWDVDAAEKGGYPHFMLKEIHEEPKALRDTLYPRLNEDGRLDLTELGLDDATIRGIDKILIVACGSASHAGYVGRYVIEHLARIPCEVDIGSEFRYRDPIIRPGTYVIAISQSGETADTIAAIREAHSRGARVAAIVNVVGSTISREADDVFYTWAGPEIAVATTKGYTTQVLAFYMIALQMALVRETITEQDYMYYLDALKQVPDHVQTMIDRAGNVARYAKMYKAAKDVFYIGRGLDYALSLEGSLKLKEVSYVHSEAYAAGELKHGTIALIEDGTLVVALATQEALYDKMLSNIKEVKARGARVLALVMEGYPDMAEEADHVIEIPRNVSLMAPIAAIIPLQLLGYFIAVEKGCDVDKPRNLAKSVTVE
jgi:glucosamine--fructose-6-phosphate aminotransferase (isomerizing)